MESWYSLGHGAGHRGTRDAKSEIKEIDKEIAFIRVSSPPRPGSLLLRIPPHSRRSVLATFGPHCVPSHRVNRAGEAERRGSEERDAHSDIPGKDDVARRQCEAAEGNLGRENSSARRHLFFCVQSIARLRSKVAQLEHAQVTRSRVAATQKKQKELSRFGLPIWRQTATRTGRFTHGYDHSYAPVPAGMRFRCRGTTT